MTDIEVLQSKALISPEGGRALTNRIKASVEETWHLLLQAYDRKAHIALGYKSWGEYFEAEFGQHQSRGYQLIDASRVVRAIESHSTKVERPTERQARALAPLARSSPEEAAEVWGEVVEAHGKDVTARVVREAVLERQATTEDEPLEPIRLQELPPFELSDARRAYYKISRYLIGLTRLDPEQVAVECESAAAALSASEEASKVIDWFERYRSAVERRGETLEPGNLRRIK